MMKCTTALIARPLSHRNFVATDDTERDNWLGILNTMQATDLQNHVLPRYITDIESAAMKCQICVPAEAETSSHFGGLPVVDDDFCGQQKLDTR